MKRFATFLFGIMAVLGGLGLIWLGVMALVVQRLLQQPVPMEAASIGIIGGADGPTAIILAVNPAGWTEPVIFAVLLLAGLGGLVCLNKFRKS